MRERAPTRRLRGADPLTVEVELPALVALPIHQLAGGTLADLMALCERDDLAPGTSVRLRGYPDRVARSLKDLPGGNPIGAVLDELSTVEASHVPASLRHVLQVEADRRGSPDGDAIVSLLGSWSESEPEAFAFGERRVKTREVREGPRRKEKLGTRQAGVAEAPRREAPRPRNAPPQTANPQQTGWVRQTVLERLLKTAGAGLLEPVLLAAVRHRARERFPELTENDIRAVLRQMANQGEIRFSARRWLAAGR